jgi:hypothetical protein
LGFVCLFLAVLGFELRLAMQALFSHSISTISPFLYVLDIFKIGSGKLFAWLKSSSSQSQPPK